MSVPAAYLLAINVAVILLVSLAVYSWTRRHLAGWTRLAAVALCAAVGDVFVGLMAVAPLEWARLLLSLKYLMLGASSVTMFLFVAGQTGRWRQPRRGRLAALVALPVLGHLAAFHDGWGSIQTVSFGTAYGGMTAITAITFGPLYWMTTAYHYGLQLTALVYVVTFISRGGAIERGQGAALLAGVLAPSVLNVLGVAGAIPRGLDLMPIGQAVAALALFWGALRHRMLDVVPVARHALADALQDGILIVDGQGRVLDLNRSMAALLDLDPGAAVGRPLDERLIPNQDVATALKTVAASPLPVDGGLSPVTRRSPLRLGERVFDMRGMAVGATSARVIVVEDVTERQRWQDEQADLIARLQTALADVKTLSGLLPICAGCKKIRDDEGAWQPLEGYIKDRTGAEFTHGMCPSCVARWFPDYDSEAQG